MEFVVTNPHGVTEHTGPSITTPHVKTYAAGAVLHISEIIATENEMWGKIKNKDRAYIPIDIDTVIYCVELKAVHDEWRNEVDEFLRTLGYDGVKP